MRPSRLISRILLVVFGTLSALIGLEVALRFVEFGPHDGSRDGYRRMHYIYTKTGLGKCYPSDPRAYFPYDLRTEEGRSRLGSIIHDVTGVTEDWPIEEKVEYLREHAPFCNNIELPPLNGGPHPERARKMLIVGDSFAFGEGLRLRDTLGYVMAERLTTYNFPNMAWPGSSIDAIVDVAKSRIEAEAVLYFYNVNDVGLTEPLLHRRDLLHDQIREATAAARGWADAEPPVYCAYSRLCRLWRFRAWELRRSRAAIDYYRDIYFAAENRVPREATFDKIESIRDALAERDVRFVVVMFPLYYKAPFAEYPLRDVHDLVAEKLDARDIEFIDLLPAFDDYLLWQRLTVHPLDRHPSAAAIEIAAGYVADRL